MVTDSSLVLMYEFLFASRSLPPLLEKPERPRRYKVDGTVNVKHLKLDLIQIFSCLRYTIVNVTKTVLCSQFKYVSSLQPQLNICVLGDAPTRKKIYGVKTVW